MRIKPNFIFVILACLAVACLSVSTASARGSSATGKTTEQLAQLAVDLHEISNLMNLHAWYHAASMNDVELEEIWSKRDDIVWAQNSGYWIGPESIKEYYGMTVSRESTKGSFVWHTITTPVVEVAADGKTAKGVWYTPGIVGSFKGEEGDFNWMFEKYGVDFIREDGVWKVWHMHVYTDTAWPVGGKITAGGGMGGPPPGDDQAPPQQGETVGSEAATMPMPMKGPDKSEVNYKELSPTTEIVLVPRPPVPYKTWSETWSYVDPGE